MVCYIVVWLAEAYGYLKGPADMLQLYEQKYQKEVQKFGGEQIGRRRRDDYTDGTIRIPVTTHQHLKELNYGIIIFRSWYRTNGNWRKCRYMGRQKLILIYKL